MPLMVSRATPVSRCVTVTVDAGQHALLFVHDAAANAGHALPRFGRLPADQACRRHTQTIRNLRPVMVALPAVQPQASGGATRVTQRPTERREQTRVLSPHCSQMHPDTSPETGSARSGGTALSMPTVARQRPGSHLMRAQRLGRLSSLRQWRRRCGRCSSRDALTARGAERADQHAPRSPASCATRRARGSPGATVPPSICESRTRVQAVTDAEGRYRLPLTAPGGAHPDGRARRLHARAATPTSSPRWAIACSWISCSRSAALTESVSVSGDAPLLQVTTRGDQRRRLERADSADAAQRPRRPRRWRRSATPSSCRLAAPAAKRCSRPARCPTSAASARATTSTCWTASR